MCFSRIEDLIAHFFDKKLGGRSCGCVRGLQCVCSWRHIIDQFICPIGSSSKPLSKRWVRISVMLKCRSLRPLGVFMAVPGAKPSRLTWGEVVASPEGQPGWEEQKWQGLRGDAAFHAQGQWMEVAYRLYKRLAISNRPSFSQEMQDLLIQVCKFIKLMTYIF